MDYKKYICPVCKENFKDDDDVVVCPDCGAPHHRKCWFENGKCFNDSLHGQQEIIIEKNENIEEEIQEEGNIEVSQKATDFNENREDFVFRPKEPEIENNPSSTYLINGREAFYYQIAVRKNMKYYVPTFSLLSERGPKFFSWNIAAFFVPLAWAFYRKMYKIVALMLALYTIIFGIMSYYNFTDEAVSEITDVCYKEDPNFAEKILSSYMGKDVVLTENQQKYMQELEKERVPRPVGVTINIVLMASRILLALNVNKLYMKEIDKTIKKGEKKGLNGELLKFYVYKKRGTFPFLIAAAIGFFEWLIF